MGGFTNLTQTAVSALATQPTKPQSQSSDILKAVAPDPRESSVMTPRSANLLATTNPDRYDGPVPGDFYQTPRFAQNAAEIALNTIQDLALSHLLQQFRPQHIAIGHRLNQSFFCRRCVGIGCHRLLPHLGHFIRRIQFF